MYRILLLVFLVSGLFAFSDSDMDGVDDRVDKCPNTPFSDLVDINGCTKKSLVSHHHFDIIVGFNYSQTSYETLEDSDNFSTSLQIDYYYKNFSLQASTSYYDSSSVSYNSSGMNDSFIGVYYTFIPLDKLTLKVGTGVVIPTYKSDFSNNNTDFLGSVNISYLLKNDINLFGGYIYTLINDDDTLDIKYQDTSSYSLGTGYHINQKIYVSGSYNSSESIYEGVEEIKTISVYGYYSIDKNWFSTLNYARGLSDSASDNFVSLRVGYYF